MSEYVDLVARAREKLESFQDARQTFVKATEELKDARTGLNDYVESVKEFAATLEAELIEYGSTETLVPVAEETTDAVAVSVSDGEPDVEETNTEVPEPAETAVSDESPEPKKASRKASKVAKEKEVVEPVETVVDESPVEEEITPAEPEPVATPSENKEAFGLWDDDEDDDDDLFRPATPTSNKTKTAASGSKGGLFDSTNVDEVQF